MIQLIILTVKKKKKWIHVVAISCPFRHRRQCTCKVNGDQPIVSFRTMTSERGRQTGAGSPPGYKSSETDFPGSIRSGSLGAASDGSTEIQRPSGHKQQQHVWSDTEILRTSQKENRRAQCAPGDGQNNHRSGHWEVLLPWESFGKGSANRVSAATAGFIPTNKARPP